jgi:hypothetical protein
MIPQCALARIIGDPAMTISRRLVRIGSNYSSAHTGVVHGFLDSVADMGDGTTNDTVDAVLSRAGSDSGFNLPPALDSLMGKLTTKGQKKLLGAMLDGIELYAQTHGEPPSADWVDSAISQSRVAIRGVGDNGSLLDDATSLSHDASSIQANRAAIVLMGAIAEAMPFAAALPPDINSNEQPIIIVEHVANADMGDYAKGDSMDGADLGGLFGTSARFVRVDHAHLPFEITFTAKGDKETPGFGGSNAAGTTGIPLYRNRTAIFVNGIRAAVETGVNANSATSQISGSITIDGLDHAITGSVNPDTGKLVIAQITPALPAGSSVIARAVLNYEKAPGLTPGIIITTSQFSIFAETMRMKAEIGIDAAQQFPREIGIDPEQEAILTTRKQITMERHYLGLRLAAELAKNTSISHDFSFSVERANKAREDMWRDFMTTLAMLDQVVANKTQDHGIDFLYVNDWVAAQIRALPPEYFSASGVQPHAGLYYVGVLFGKRVYRVPARWKILADDPTGETAQILAIGRSAQATRCPIVTADPVPLMPVEIATNGDMTRNRGFYGRWATETNPHHPSAMGCAIIHLSGMK